jgi:hypothetical protein
MMGLMKERLYVSGCVVVSRDLRRLSSVTSCTREMSEPWNLELQLESLS